MEYVVKGMIKFGDGGERRFEKRVEAKSERDAREKVYALFGSSNRVRRDRIKIEVVEHA
ncbi:MAG: 50S ribosomal protein L18Ae [Candidatus Anstonellales archaeon]